MRGDRNSEATVLFKKSEMYTTKRGFHTRRNRFTTEEVGRSKSYSRYKKQKDNNRERANSAL